MDYSRHTKVRSPLGAAVDTTLRAAGRDPLTVRFTVLVDGLTTTGDPFTVTIAGGDAVEVAQLVTVDLINAHQHLAGAA